jgi:hypothetical protein
MRQDRTSMKTLANVFPVLATIKTSDTDKIELVNTTAVEEGLLDIGMLDFGKGVKAKANVAVWRTRGDQKQLVGEFAFQCKFQRRNELHDAAEARRAVLLLASAERTGLDLARNDQNRSGLSTQRQSTSKSRVNGPASDSCEETAPSTAGYFGLMKYTQDFQDQQIQLLKEQRKKQNPAALSPHRSGNSG